MIEGLSDDGLPQSEYCTSWPWEIRIHHTAQTHLHNDAPVRTFYGPMTGNARAKMSAVSPDGLLKDRDNSSLPASIEALSNSPISTLPAFGETLESPQDVGHFLSFHCFRTCFSFEPPRPGFFFPADWAVEVRSLAGMPD